MKPTTPAHKDRIREVDITIVQTPVYVKFECPHCEAEVEIPYKEMVDTLGDSPCDWDLITCPECGGLVRIDDMEWD